MTKRKNKKSGVRLPNVDLAWWLRVVEQLIAKHTSKPRKSGKFKGHGMTDPLAWTSDLARAVNKYILDRNKGRVYDGNMALASLLGLILCTWYAQVHRAKGFDPNRPLIRRGVFKQLAHFRSALAVGIADERIMGRVWGKGQQWNFPFGKGARGGQFV